VVGDDPVHNQIPEQIPRDIIVARKNFYFTVHRKENPLGCLLKPEKVNRFPLRRVG